MTTNIPLAKASHKAKPYIVRSVKYTPPTVWGEGKWILAEQLPKLLKTSSLNVIDITSVFRCIGLTKKCLQFLSKNKRHIFHFHQQLYQTTYSPFCSTTFCQFSGNFIIPSSQNFLCFWVKNCSRCLLQSSGELKFFPLREFCKDRNKWKSEGAMSGEYGGWIRTFQPSCNSFRLVIKETCGLALSWWKIMCFLLTNSRHFLSSAAFSWSNWEQYLLELIIWFSRRSS